MVQNTMPAVFRGHNRDVIFNAREYRKRGGGASIAEEATVLAAKEAAKAAEKPVAKWVPAYEEEQDVVPTPKPGPLLSAWDDEW
ncbi:MAG: hypothetical protein ABJA98_16185 [Acidobacteriota bacterium]